MIFQVINGRNGGYPCIAELMEFPNISFKKPYGINFLVCNENSHDGYPSMMCMKEFPCMSMRIPYPHGMMICCGDDFNDGYPFIPEITAVGIKTESSLFYNDNPVCDMYYNGEYITLAYCNGQRVFFKKYGNI